MVGGETPADEEYFNVVARKPSLSGSAGKAFRQKTGGGFLADKPIGLRCGNGALRLMGDYQQQAADDEADRKQNYSNTHGGYSRFVAKRGENPEVPHVFSVLAQNAPCGGDLDIRERMVIPTRFERVTLRLGI